MAIKAKKKKPAPKGKTLGAAILAVAGAVASRGLMAAEDTEQIAADFIDSLGLKVLAQESLEETLAGLGIDILPEVAAGASGPWVLAAFVGSPMLLLGLVETILSLPFLMIIAPLLAAMYAAHNVSIGVGPVNLRLGAVFDPIVGLLELVVHFMGDRIGATIDQAVRSVKLLVYGIAVLFGVATQQYAYNTAKKAAAPIAHDVAVIRKQIHGINSDLYHGPGGLLNVVHALQSEIAHLNEENGKLWHQVNLLHAPNVGKMQQDLNTLRQQVAHLSSSVGTVERELSHVPKLPQTIAKQVAEQGRELQQTEHEVTAIREQLKHIKPAPLTHTGLTHKQQHDLTVAFDFSHLLAPLAGLGLLTAANVGNLRKLADDPCQCPQIGGIPNPIMALVAADFILKDGI